MPGGIWGNPSAPSRREELHAQLYLVCRTTSEPVDTLREGIEEPYGPHVLSLCAPTGELRITQGPPDSHGA